MGHRRRGVPLACRGTRPAAAIGRAGRPLGRVRAARRPRRAVLRLLPGSSAVGGRDPGRDRANTARDHREASGDDHADFSVGALILFEAAAVGLGLLLILSHRINRIRVQQGVLLGAAAGLGFGISDVAIKAISGDVLGGVPWIALALVAALASFFASARSLQIGEGVAVIAVTSVAANMSAILAGVVVFGDPMGSDALEVIARAAAFVMVLGGAALMPAPVRAADAVSRQEPAIPAT